MQPFMSESSYNEISFYTIKSLGQINFNHESLIFSSAQIKRVSYVLSSDYVTADPSTLNESLLRWMNLIREMS